MRWSELQNKRVAIWGYGREGKAALVALRQQFPSKQVTLFCNAEECSQALKLHDSNLEIFPGEPDSVILMQFDAVIKSPGISPYQPTLEQASNAGVVFTSGTAIWLAEHLTEKCIFVTGTKGKSTTSSLIAHLLRKGGYCVALAGNIGLPLLDANPTNYAVDCWVIELSSFQTREVKNAIDILVVNNLFPEHLDWHGSIEQYYSDKLSPAIYARQLLVNATQPEFLARTATHSARHLFGNNQGWHVANGWIYRGEEAVFLVADIPLPGLHNAQNVCAALSAIEAAGYDALRLVPHVKSFRPLPHRLQWLGAKDGIDYINDSISTTPHAALAALATCSGKPTTIILGGHDRGLDWSFVAERLTELTPHAVVTQGTNGTMIAQLLRAVAEKLGFTLREAENFSTAVQLAQQLTPNGGVILLSPGAPSLDQFRDYTERGREFACLGGFDADQIIGIEGLGVR